MILGQSESVESRWSFAESSESGMHGGCIPPRQGRRTCTKGLRQVKGRCQSSSCLRGTAHDARRVSGSVGHPHRARRCPTTLFSPHCPDSVCDVVSVCVWLHNSSNIDLVHGKVGHQSPSHFHLLHGLLIIVHCARVPFAALQLRSCGSLATGQSSQSVCVASFVLSCVYALVPLSCCACVLCLWITYHCLSSGLLFLSISGTLFLCFLSVIPALPPWRSMLSWLCMP